MKFVHISDTHLGAGFGRRVSSSGVNQREEDICSVFEFAINKIIELKPDFVVHSGDFFHSVRPSNRIINFGVRQIKRLSDLQIPIVIISGNHDSPKQRMLGSIFSLFEIFEHVYVVHKNQYEIKKLNNCAIHCIPNCSNQEIFNNELDKLTIDISARYNILVLHGELSTIREFAQSEIGGLQIPDSIFNLPFDYVALGHFHKFDQMKHNTYYAGSTERITLRDIGEEKVFVEYNLETKTLTTHLLPTRERIILHDLDASELNPEQLIQELENIMAKKDYKDKMIILKVVNVPEHVYNLLPFRKINELKENIFIGDIRLEKKRESGEVQATRESIGRLSEEFTEYLSKIPVEVLDKNKLLDLGLKYLTVVKVEE